MSLTYNEKYLHCDVTDGCAAGQVIIISDEAHIVWNGHSHVESSE